MKAIKVSINTVYSKLREIRKRVRANVGFDDYSLETSIYMQLMTTRKVILNPMIIKLINIAYIILLNTYITTSFVQ